MAEPESSPNDQLWTPDSWRLRTALHQPPWPNADALAEVEQRLATLPPLVLPSETKSLASSLADVCDGRAFLLQAGDCAETFGALNHTEVENKLRVMLQMSIILTYAAGLPVVKVGRIAGQYAKPRTSPTEQVGDEEILTFRGYLVNDDTPTAEARTPDPQRLLYAYEQASGTLALLGDLLSGGFAALDEVHKWNQSFVASSPEGRRYESLAEEIDAALSFMRACHIDLDGDPELRKVSLWTSHEALLLGLEQALTRQDPVSGRWFATSAATVWIGERTRQVDGAHVEWARGIANPIGVKVGPTAEPSEITELVKVLNPARTPGRLTLISRMGAGLVADRLPGIIDAVKQTDIPVIWACDPMHGNTFASPTGHKTRHFDEVLREVEGFFATCHLFGVHPGGLHVELTGEDVTECVGGSNTVEFEDLANNYESPCDPRLNAGQAIDLAFRTADFLRN